MQTNTVNGYVFIGENNRNYPASTVENQYLGIKSNEVKPVWKNRNTRKTLMNQLLCDKPLSPPKKRKAKTKHKENDAPQPVITRIKLPDISKEDKKITNPIKISYFDPISQTTKIIITCQRKYLKSVL